MVLLELKEIKFICTDKAIAVGWMDGATGSGFSFPSLSSQFISLGYDLIMRV